MLSAQDVIQAYRLILGREPESPEMVNRYAAEIKDLDALRDLFISSSEFRQHFDRVHASRRTQRGFFGAPMYVELDATPDQLMALCAKTAAQWDYLGKTEPFWSVLTQENYLTSRIEQSKADFYATGEIEASVLDSALARHGIEPRPEGRCLELGCGVGRVTGALARRYREVVALDISEPHLLLAKDALQARGINNVHYEQLKSLTEILSYGAVDLFYSKIVLQHNPPPVMGLLLRAMLNALTPGGVGSFQIPVFKAGYQFTIASYLKEENATNMEMHFFPQAELLNLIADADCRVCELFEDDSIGVSPNMLSNTVLVQKLS